MKPVNVFTVQTRTDPEDPPGYRAAAVKLGPAIGADRIGASVYDLEPGESVCPYHFEFGSEEWLLVLRGRPALRRADGESEVEEVLEPGDLVCFPAGPAGAHKVTNTSEDSLRIMMFSTMPEVDISYYPDSEKYGVWPGAHKGFLVRRETEVDYYDGEK